MYLYAVAIPLLSGKYSVSYLCRYCTNLKTPLLIILTECCTFGQQDKLAYMHTNKNTPNTGFIKKLKFTVKSAMHTRLSLLCTNSLLL